MGEIISSKNGRLHIYVRQDKYKGKLKSENWKESKNPKFKSAKNRGPIARVRKYATPWKCFRKEPDGTDQYFANRIFT